MRVRSKCVKEEERRVQVTSERKAVIHSRPLHTTKELDSLTRGEQHTSLLSHLAHKPTLHSLSSRHKDTSRSLFIITRADHLIRTQSLLSACSRARIYSLDEITFFIQQQRDQRRPVTDLGISPSHPGTDELKRPIDRLSI